MNNDKEPTIYTERAVELSDRTQPNASTKEELRKEFFQKLKESQGFLNSLNWFFDWLYSKLLTYQQEIAAQKKLTKDEIKRVSDIYQEEIDRYMQLSGKYANDLVVSENKNKEHQQEIDRLKKELEKVNNLQK